MGPRNLPRTQLRFLEHNRQDQAAAKLHPVDNRLPLLGRKGGEETGIAGRRRQAIDPFVAPPAIGEHFGGAYLDRLNRGLGTTPNRGDRVVQANRRANADHELLRLKTFQAMADRASIGPRQRS